MPKINIRYNTNFPENSRYQWRVLIDGIEKLANDVLISTPCYTTSEKIEGVGIKYHITTNSDNVKINSVFGVISIIIK